MGKLKVKCIACGNDCREIDSKEEGESGGLCEACLIVSLVPLYRARQRREGNPDCFGKSNGYCDQLGCKYLEKCLSPKKPSSEKIENFLRQLSQLSKQLIAGSKPLANLV